LLTYLMSVELLNTAENCCLWNCNSDWTQKSWLSTEHVIV